MALAGNGRRPRRHDPARRGRMVTAAIEVIGRDGIDGLTLRAVAKQADVPLGSTSYHFADKNELLMCAMDAARAASNAAQREYLAQNGADEDFALAMARMVEETTTRRRDRLLVDVELFLAARTRPSLRDGAEGWIDDCAALFSRYCSPERAEALTLLMEGFLVHAVVLGRGYEVAESLPSFRAALGGGDAADGALSGQVPAVPGGRRAP